ncbi:hypothetical protein P5673_004325 [Acropora cervicornis]|uniref:Uncharacterized protein n=1 Tax=Acropora cervicornis TaxID=6130 RepID=A0AAD9R045_ACRCE|nr:hypothetical protein P5673_004325 [Acropora cervicornis]
MDSRTKKFSRVLEDYQYLVFLKWQSKDLSVERPQNHLKLGQDQIPEELGKLGLATQAGKRFTPKDFGMTLATHLMSGQFANDNIPVEIITADLFCKTSFAFAKYGSDNNFKVEPYTKQE